MSTYIIATRNLFTGKLLIVNDDEEYPYPAEFETEEEAIAVARENQCCLAWGYQILTVDRPDMSIKDPKEIP